jgi:hypothetical protein
MLRRSRFQPFTIARLGPLQRSMNPLVGVRNGTGSTGSPKKVQRTIIDGGPGGSSRG